MAKKKTPGKSKSCSCGKPLTTEDAEFWGECERCRRRLPLMTFNGGDSPQVPADITYHGGQFNRGEW